MLIIGLGSKKYCGGCKNRIRLQKLVLEGAVPNFIEIAANLDRPERIAIRAPRHKEKMFIINQATQ
jgi:hypothetical protein